MRTKKRDSFREMVSMSDFESSSEQTPLIEDNVQIFYGQECIGKGKLSISDENILWEKSDGSNKMTLEYPYISVHGISTEPGNFPHQCVFCLVDAVLPGSIQNQEDAEYTEVRIVPDDTSLLQKIYDYIAEGQRNNPDPDEEEDEEEMDEAEFFDSENMDNVQLSEEGQAVLDRLAQNMSMPTQDEFAEMIRFNGENGQPEAGQFDDAEITEEDN